MLANILDAEEAMLLAAILFCDSVAVFFDVAAAFPSIEHALLFAYFQSLGWPQWLTRMISILYSGNTCDICMGKHVFLGFAITRGIRQGCPFSPLLFAVASELLLRRLKRMVAGATNRAWADDLAMIIPGGIHVLHSICNIFDILNYFLGFV